MLFPRFNASSGAGSGLCVGVGEGGFGLEAECQ